MDINGGSFTSSIPADFSIHQSAGNVMNRNTAIFSSLYTSVAPDDTLHIFYVLLPKV